MKLTNKDIESVIEEELLDDDAPVPQNRHKKVDLSQNKISNRIVRFRNGVDEKRNNNKTYGK